MGGGYNANRMTARDAEDALAALRLLPSRAEQSLDHRGSIILGVKTNPLLRAPAENFASNRRDHTRSLSSLPGVTLPMPPSTLKELERRQRQPQQRVYRDPVRASRTHGPPRCGPTDALPCSAVDRRRHQELVGGEQQAGVFQRPGDTLRRQGQQGEESIHQGDV